MLTITKEQLDNLIKNAYLEGCNDAYDAYGYELSRNGYYAGVDLEKDTFEELFDSSNAKSELGELEYEDL